MVKVSVKESECSINVIGERMNITAEAVLAFMALAEAIAPAVGMSFDSAALLLYQQGVAAHKKKEEFERGKKA